MIVAKNEDKQSPWHPLFDCLRKQAFNFAIYPSTSLDHISQTFTLFIKEMEGFAIDKSKQA
jgi:hypothetical protein